MKVLVTGGTGYIGSTTAKALEAAGHTPVVLDSLLTGPRVFVKDRIFYEGDIADRGLLSRIVDEHPDIDATIRVFKPDIGLEDMPERPVPPPNAAFRGEVQRFLLDTLRRADSALTTHDLARKVMEARQLNTADRILFALIA